MFSRNLALAVDNTARPPIDVSHLGAPQMQSEGDALWHEDEDGGATVYLGANGIGAAGASEDDLRSAPFDANLAELLDEGVLNGIAENLIEGIDADLESRKEWEDLLRQGMELLGFKIEDRTFPFKGAAGVYHPVMTEAIIRFQASARGEMLPAKGPVKTEVVGDDTPDADSRAEDVQDAFNYHLTETDQTYYPGFDSMLMWLGVAGTTFKKVYNDPFKKYPVAPFILPDQLVVNYGATSLDDAARITQIIPTSKTELIRKQLVGLYRKVELGEPDEEESDAQNTRNAIDGRTPSMAQGDDRYTIYECHADINIDVPGVEHVGPRGEDSDLPLPYIVTLDKDTRKVLAVYRNWDKDDPNYATGPARSEYFIKYGLIPGLGFYDFGYAHLLGGIAKGSTMLLRQLLDSGTLANFPGGLRVKGMKVDDSSIVVGPCEFKEIDTGGLPIQDSVMALPYKDPSEVLVQLLGALTEAAQRLGATADMQVGEGRQDAPVGTTVALIEQAMKIMSAIHKRLHVSHRKELRLLAKCFAQSPGQQLPFRRQGKMGAVPAASFAAGFVDIIPVSDPNLPTQTQRLALADAKMKLAIQAPQLHDMRTAYEDFYRTLGMTKQEIARIMPPQQAAQPTDPVTEFQMVMKGAPIAAGPNQNHDAHITAHMGQAQIPGIDKTPAYSALIAHIAEHTGMKYRNLVMLAAQQHGMQLPPPGAPLPPQLENQISLLTAQATQAVLAQFQQHLDPETALKSQELQLKGEELRIKEEDNQRKAAESEAQQRTELVKTQSTFQNDERERSSRERQGVQRIEAERIKASGNIAQAHITAATDHAAMRHETGRAFLDHHATMTGHGIAASQVNLDHRNIDLEQRRIPIEHKEADAAILAAKADGIAARKPNPRPAAR